MPPKVKTDKQDVINAAFQVSNSSGVSSISAKSISAVLGTSVAPIFRVFRNMEEVKTETISFIYDYYIKYLKNYPYQRSQFFTYGLAYIKFAKQYPNLFDALMEYGFFTPDAVGKMVSEQFEFIEDSVVSVSNLKAEQAQELFYHVWLYTHGTACLVSKKSLILTEDEEKNLLITAFQAFLRDYELQNNKV